MTATTTTEVQCKYAYKECNNVRTYKRDGGLHRLCEYHRSKANALQKIYATKRRGELRAQKRQLLAEKLVVKAEPLALTFAHEWTTHGSSFTDFTVGDLDDIDWCSILPETDELEPIECLTDIEALSDEECSYLSRVL
ncbi:hypothetical protein H257_13707 [Aphanomyces astaci]|uniref:Uncharacterized protein n=1 Tax=Aphanomyces astaci TaxID=112090 RepID=W4FVX8_APHAT|nr:hypothetical protein H257_13707 [Aphanomyces astaci]ETV70974.1 hypothetical protein H257_13707 [Aphanomyces astaci]KAF0762048.1 hypothetical protein AaE_003354 [Aphanomyces astaci]RHY12056.1 hypothetical protein DYB36_001101 [Aphanomyces astaci]RHZ02606.1 hypothetical protein DYB26_009878 [Aphanomyces astaci]RHZ27517.1 hypothetical protein DYB31_009973 [Aphanomyces astaci]|eukprot:XP_009839637.1 hypothetical protein H257_13707 [Aphanomyces astaci]